LKKSLPAISEIRLRPPLERDSITPDEIIARLAELDEIGDIPLKYETVLALVAELMELEDELIRLTDPDHKRPRN
jgi:hypothetical protein